MGKIKVEILEGTADKDGWYKTSVAGRKALFPKGHSHIGILKDKKSGKYGIINHLDMTATEPFLDDVDYCEDSMGTWVEDYVIGRIGKFYYIVNRHGDCFQENELQYLICRNVIVALNPQKRSMKFRYDTVFYDFAFIGVVNSKLKYIQYNSDECNGTYILEVKGKGIKRHYCFAFCCVWRDIISILDIYGEAGGSELCDWRKGVPLITKYSSFLVNNWVLRFKEEQRGELLEKDFKRW